MDGRASSEPRSERERVAETVRAACLEAAASAFDDAGVQGLCPEGRLEVALGAIRSLDLRPILRNAGSSRGSR